MIANILRTVCVVIALLGLAGFSGTATKMSGKVSAANSAIEQTMGATLAKPVFQCGTGSDSATEDALPGSVTLFESGPVRPITLSADGKRLFVTNRPAHCLEIYAVEGDTLRLVSAVAVGLEPVAVAERNGNEVWVVNHLSDSVSVVRLDGTPRVLRTLQVGDEPRDIVFAGPNRDRAFITAAFRGQNRPNITTANLTTAGQGRADVWVFDAANLDDSLTGHPLTILTLFADTPRALAVSPDGATVYAAPLFSGNGTTTLHRDAVIFRKPAPSTSKDGVIAPETGLIVKFDGTAWRDETKKDWSSSVKFSLPDYDLFAIDANAALPTMKSRVSGVGTTLFNLAVHPQSGRVYVSNTEAKNEIRFEGPGTSNSTVRGRLAESRISVVDVTTQSVDAVHLNSHVNFSVPEGQAISAADKAKSLAQPTAMVFSPGGETLYVAALGSNKVAALPTLSITTSTFSPNSTQHINLPDGPAGLALNAAGTRLFAYSHVAHSVSVIDTKTLAVVKTTPLFSPDSQRVKSGRRILYDANFTSSNGTSSCASCHTFADLDHLAWDLGNPDDTQKTNINAYVSNSPRTTPKFHPMKGPMTTQTLRGMVKNGPTHWRGDRTGGNRATVRGTLETLEEASFKEFNPAFVGLLGRQAPLSDADMQAFTDFAMALKMPPNPVRALDNSLSAEEQAGSNTYFNVNNITGLGSCNHCHTLNPVAGQFGTGGLMSFEGFRITENFKVPHLRNMYQKVGMFGFSAGTVAATGPQIRGFGFSHDGSIDTLTNFFSDPVFNFPAPVATTRDQVVAFMLAMDADFLPVVGQQVTWRPGASAAVETRLNLLKAQAKVTTPRAACELVVRGNIDGSAHTGLMQRDGAWQMRSGKLLTDAALQALASSSQPLTFTCLPPTDAKRVALGGGVAAANAVVEYYFAPLDQYFITASASDKALLDSGVAVGWARTGQSFNQGGGTAVCRFYGSTTPGPNSHFYTAVQSECDLLKSLQASTPATQPRLNFESLDFLTTPAVNGVCAAGMVPVYRAYNDGAARGRDGNHRFTTDPNAIAQVVARGWVNEGVVMCAAP
jgi:DNA-binding beta-propeller fold protein YncE